MSPPRPGGVVSRREWLAALPALAAVPALRGLPWQVPTVSVSGLHSVTLAVSDFARSTDFYQEVFGLPVQARPDAAVVLRLGRGPTFLALEPAGREPVRIARFGMTVADFDAERVAAALAVHGVRRVREGRGDPGPMEMRLVAPGGSPSIVFGDPHGMVVHLTGPGFCGAGVETPCGEAVEAPTRGSLQLLGFSHFTNNAADPQRSVDFYRAAFGLDIQTYQAAAPLLGVGEGDEFLMFIGGAVGRTVEEAARVPGRVHHACLTVANFSVEGVQAALEAHGIRSRDREGPGPLRHWVSMRMPNRGGAPQGTPELYFSDPDGLAIQLQDAAYCGGGGLLGEVCE